MKISLLLTTLKRLSLLFLALMISTIVATLFSAKSPTHAIDQAKERAVKIKTFKEQPVEIVAVNVKGTPVEAEKKFAGNSDWLNGMTITIKNVSEKPVVYVAVAVTAHYEKDGVRRRTSDGRDYVVAIDLMYGVRPHLPGEPPRPYRATPLMPGQTADLLFSEIQRDQLFWILSHEDYSTDVTELTLSTDYVAWYGEDETMWIRGRMHRLDPKDPRHWVPVEDPSPPRSRLNHAPGKPKFELARLEGLLPENRMRKC